VCVVGLTHASVWAAGCSYMTQAVPVDNRPTAQMILHSLHHAFGRGCGALIGGAIINSYGTVDDTDRSLGPPHLTLLTRFLRSICPVPLRLFQGAYATLNNNNNNNNNKWST